MPSPEDIPFGPVIVVRGPHKGRVGIYDDDDEDQRGRPRLVVYLYDGAPAANTMAVVAEREPSLLLRSHFRVASESESIAILGLMQRTYSVEQLIIFARNHPDGLRALGVDAIMQRTQDLLAGSDDEAS